MRRTLIWVTTFSAAMAFLESAVVVYLRALYYPQGFAFPLTTMDPHLAVTEIIREAATILMLVSVAAMASRRTTVGFAWFIYAFAVWDILYYVYLWLLLGWPQSLLTWDLLFLIPVVWAGPVLAPVLNSLTMILLAGLVIRYSPQHEKIRLKGLEWTLLIGGSVITLISYTQDYLHFMLNRFSFLRLVTFQDYQEVLAYSTAYVPVSFPWLTFALGEVMFLISIILIRKRLK